MARTIDPAVQTLLEADQSTINLVLEIFWTSRTADNTVERLWYSDTVIDGHPEVNPTILSLPPIDAAVQVLQGGQSKSVAVKLDDISGDLKAIYDVNDLHKVPCRVWVHVDGTDFDTKKFPIFLGQINSPVVYDEGTREFSFTVVNRIEDVEVGFSYEEGAGEEELPEELIGQPFPLCFGTTKNVPALKAVPTISGILSNGVGIADFTLTARQQLAEAITCPRTPIGFKCATQGTQVNCSMVYETDQNCLQSRCLEIELLRVQFNEQSAYEYGEIVIFGGEKFPQGWNTNTPTVNTNGQLRSTGSGNTGRLNRLTLNINGGLFTGYFDGTPETPSTVFAIESRQHPRFDPATGTVLEDPVGLLLESACPGDDFRSEDSNYTDVWSGQTYTGLRDSRISWEKYRNAKAADFFWAPGGATVTIEDIREIVYVANLVPSTIHSVKAKRFLNGNEFLLTVPSEFFEIRQTNYSGYTGVMEIVLQRPLSSESKDTGGGWSDELYVTQTSTVGPNTIDILRWFIETYTTYAIDEPSFGGVKPKLEAYPMHFPLLRRPNLLNILQELARKARCAIWQRDDTFFVKYLAEEPTPVATIEYGDILRSSPDDSGRNLFKLELSTTEDLITKHTSEWKDDYGPFTTKPKKLILRHNVDRYGTHDQTEDFFPFRHLDIVRKSATFWLIRSANTWKRIRITTTLEFAALEPFDAVTLRLPDLARDATGAAVDVLGVVERAVLDSDGKQIDFEIWTPVRAGELLPYDFAFPAFIAEASLFPTIDARNKGDAGSGSEPNFSTIAPPGHPLNPNRGAVFSGFALGCNGAPVTNSATGECRGDHGDRNPSDTGDVKPDVDTSSDVTGDVSGSTSPIGNGSGYGSGSAQWLINEQATKTEGDAGRAKEVAEQGGTGDSPGSGDNSDSFSAPLDEDFLDSLPPADETTAPYSCVVSIAGFPTGSLGFIQGVEHCGIAGPAREEKYTYDSEAGATNFCNTMIGRSSCAGIAPCNTCVNFCNIVCSGDPDKQGDGNLIGFTGTDGETPFILS